MGGATRLILPHTDPAGRIVSLYGRRIDGGGTHKHHHLKDLRKVALNAQACNGAEVWITEGPFDAMALYDQSKFAEQPVGKGRSGVERNVDGAGAPPHAPPLAMSALVGWSTISANQAAQGYQ